MGQGSPLMALKETKKQKPTTCNPCRRNDPQPRTFAMLLVLWPLHLRGAGAAEALDDVLKGPNQRTNTTTWGVVISWTCLKSGNPNMVGSSYPPKDTHSNRKPTVDGGLCFAPVSEWITYDHPTVQRASSYSIHRNWCRMHTQGQ